jgi:hypothetical protein
MSLLKWTFFCFNWFKHWKNLFLKKKNPFLVILKVWTIIIKNQFFNIIIIIDSNYSIAKKASQRWKLVSHHSLNTVCLASKSLFPDPLPYVTLFKLCYTGLLTLPSLKSLYIICELLRQIKTAKKKKKKGRNLLFRAIIKEIQRLDNIDVR